MQLTPDDKHDKYSNKSNQNDKYSNKSNQNDKYSNKPLSLSVVWFFADRIIHFDGNIYIMFYCIKYSTDTFKGNLFLSFSLS